MFPIKYFLSGTELESGNNEAREKLYFSVPHYWFLNKLTFLLTFFGFLYKQIRMLN